MLDKTTPAATLDLSWSRKGLMSILCRRRCRLDGRRRQPADVRRSVSGVLQDVERSGSLSRRSGKVTLLAACIIVRP